MIQVAWHVLRKFLVGNPTILFRPEPHGRQASRTVGSDRLRACVRSQTGARPRSGTLTWGGRFRSGGSRGRSLELRRQEVQGPTIRRHAGSESAGSRGCRTRGLQGLADAAPFRTELAAALTFSDLSTPCNSRRFCYQVRPSRPFPLLLYLF